MSLLVVGRDWGVAEAQAGRAFVGPSGTMLDRELARAGLPRAACEVTNVVEAQPPGNRWEAHTPDAVAAGVAALRAKLTRDRVVLAVGEQALHACLGLDPDAHAHAITDVRGYPFRGVGGCLVVPTIHPSFILRGAQRPYAFCFARDVAKAVRYAKGGYREPEEHAYLRSESDILSHVNTGRLAVDIETYADGSIACVAVAPSGESAVCYDKPLDTQRDELAFVLAADTLKAFHNGQFDVTVLEQAGFRVTNWQADTMLLWHALEPVLAGAAETSQLGTKKSLKFLGSVFSDRPYWKSYNFVTHRDRCLLCARDTMVTWDVWRQMEAQLAG